jgi:hypothetical protein
MKTELIQLGNTYDTHGAILTKGVELFRFETFGETRVFLAVPVEGMLYCAWATEMQAPEFEEAQLYSTMAAPPIYVHSAYGEEIGNLFDKFLSTEEAKQLAQLEPKEIKKRHNKHSLAYA